MKEEEEDGSSDDEEYESEYESREGIDKIGLDSVWDGKDKYERYINMTFRHLNNRNDWYVEDDHTNVDFTLGLSNAREYGFDQDHENTHL